MARRSRADSFRLSYSGDFSLAESVSLAAGAFFVTDQHAMRGGPSCLDLAFPVEGPWHSVAVRITQHGTQLQATICSNPEAVPSKTVRTQIERLLAIDVDGGGFSAVAARDVILEKHLERRRGVRPLLFPSPYEAAARAIIGQRLFVRQAAALTAWIAAQYGVELRIGDGALHAGAAVVSSASLTLRGAPFVICRLFLTAIGLRQCVVLQISSLRSSKQT